MFSARWAENIHKQVLFYLQSTFDFRDKAVDRALERFLTDPDTGLFKGRWCNCAARRPVQPDTITVRFVFAEERVAVRSTSPTSP